MVEVSAISQKLLIKSENRNIFQISKYNLNFRYIFSLELCIICLYYFNRSQMNGRGRPAPPSSCKISHKTLKKQLKLKLQRQYK